MTTFSRDALGAYALSTHRFILRVAGASTIAFLWLFVFGYFLRGEGEPMAEALARTLFLYALSEVVTILATPLALRYIRGSMLRGLIFGTTLLSLAYCYIALFATGLFPHGAGVIGILLGLHRALYRVPYAMEHRTLPAYERTSIREVILAVMPAVGGSLLSLGLPFSSLMFIAALLGLIALAILPLVPNTQETFSWGYRETLERFLNENNAPLLFRSLLTGAKNVALVILWPFALVLLGVQIPGLLGALISIILLVVVIFGRGRGYRALESHVDNGHYIDEYTALKEMGRALGAVLVSCAIAILSLFLS